MLVQVLGCGEASDPIHPNSSIVVEQDDWNLLIDLGYSAAQKLFLHYPEPNAIDAIYFTHAHPDHCFGLGPLLIRLKDRKRTKPLTILCNRESLDRLQKLVEISLWGLSCLASTFEVIWQAIPVASEKPLQCGPLTLRFSPTQHSVPNHAVLIEGSATLFYSGDGFITPETENLLTQASAAFVETFALTQSAAGDSHGYLPHSLKLAERNPDTHFYLYHVREDLRESLVQQVQGHPSISTPEGGARIQIT